MKKVLSALLLCIVLMSGSQQIFAASPASHKGINTYGAAMYAAKGRNSSKGSSQSQVTLAADEVQTSLPAGFTSFVVSLNDNCPRLTCALKEEVALKFTIPGYIGITKFEIKTNNGITNIKDLLSYISICQSINNAIEKEYGISYSLTFNTSADGSGTDINLENHQTAVEEMAAKNITEIFAVYRPAPSEETNQ